MALPDWATRISYDATTAVDGEGLRALRMEAQVWFRRDFVGHKEARVRAWIIKTFPIRDGFQREIEAIAAGENDISLKFVDREMRKNG